MGHKPKKWTLEEIIRIATKDVIQVHRYKDSHMTLRKMCRRLYRDGKLEMLWQTSSLFTYRVPRKGV